MSLLLVIIAAVLSVCTLGAASNFHTEGLKKELESTNSQIKIVKSQITKLHDTIELKGSEFRAEINALTRGHESKSQEGKRLLQEYLDLGKELGDLQMKEEEAVYKDETAKKNLKRVKLVLKWLTQDVENLKRRKANGDPEVCRKLAQDLEVNYDVSGNKLLTSKLTGRSFGSEASTIYLLNLKQQQAKTTLYKLMKEEEDLKSRITAYDNQHRNDVAELNNVIKNKRDNLGGIKKGIADLKDKVKHVKHNVIVKNKEYQAKVGKIRGHNAELAIVKAELRGFQNAILCYNLLETESTDYL